MQRCSNSLKLAWAGHAICIIEAWLHVQDTRSRFALECLCVAEVFAPVMQLHTVCESVHSCALHRWVSGCASACAVAIA